MDVKARNPNYAALKLEKLVHKTVSGSIHLKENMSHEREWHVVYVGLSMCAATRDI